MTITFKFEQLDSQASDLYKAQAIDENGIITEWTIACDDKTQLDIVAQQAYDEFKNPKPIVLQEQVSPSKEELLIELQNLKTRIETLENK